ncbi:MAG TPA: biotin synthase BioB, partial [Nitrospiria bacterium]|nr:biotin synthase BioB [Nitrospiria bacterium]
MPYKTFSEKALSGACLSRDEARQVLDAPDERMPDLIQAAWRVRYANSGRKVQIHMLINAKSGICEEDCHYCSQSSISSADIKAYPLLNQKELLDGASRALEARARRFCIVTSGRGPRAAELEAICSAVREIKRKTPLSICCSLGLLTAEDARALKEAGVDRVNHNINTSEDFHSNICSTHTYQDRVRTLANARAAGIELCSGGIVGMGEGNEELIDAAMALRELGPESLPVNFMHPIEGTPFGI